MASIPSRWRTPRARRVRWVAREGRLSLWAAFATFGLAGALSLATLGARRPPGDVWLARVIQDVPAPAAAEVARLAYWLGLLEVALVLAAPLVLIALWRGYRPEALLLAVVVGARAINPFLRSVVDSPRPAAGVIRVTESPDGHGFPNSHALGAVLLFGAVAYLAGQVDHKRRGRLAVQALAIAAILVTGYGRSMTGGSLSMGNGRPPGPHKRAPVVAPPERSQPVAAPQRCKACAPCSAAARSSAFVKIVSPTTLTAVWSPAMRRAAASFMPPSLFGRMVPVEPVSQAGWAPRRRTTPEGLPMEIDEPYGLPAHPVLMHVPVLSPR